MLSDHSYADCPEPNQHHTAKHRREFSNAQVYVVEVYGRGMGIRFDTKKRILRKEGTDNVRDIRLATGADVRWVRGMGGYIPDAAKALLNPEVK